MTYNSFWLAVIPCLMFLLIAGILMPDAIAVPLVPLSRRLRRVRRLAQSLFVELGLATPRDRAGVLLFVAQAERQVEILAGAGIGERVDAKTWQAVVDDFVQTARSGPLVEALIGAIECNDGPTLQNLPAVRGKSERSSGPLGRALTDPLLQEHNADDLNRVVAALKE